MHYADGYYTVDVTLVHGHGRLMLTLTLKPDPNTNLPYKP